MKYRQTHKFNGLPTYSAPYWVVTSVPSRKNLTEMFEPSSSRISAFTVWKLSGEGYSISCACTSDEVCFVRLHLCLEQRGLTLKVLKLISPVPIPMSLNPSKFSGYIPFHSAISISGGQVSAPFNQNAGHVPVAVGAWNSAWISNPDPASTVKLVAECIAPER